MSEEITFNSIERVKLSQEEIWNLKKLRIQRKITQKNIGQLLNISYRTYINYERGYNSIPKILYLKMDDFFNGELSNPVNKKESVTCAYTQSSINNKEQIRKIITSLEDFLYD